jgi:CBS domain containing-hemolysin-like protein
MDEFLQAAPHWLPGVAVMCCLVVASGFFSGSETAIFYLSRDELRSLQIGRSRERLVASLLRDPDRLLTAILFWNLLINLTFFAVSVLTARRLMNHDQQTAAGVFSVISLAAIIVFGEVLPKSVAVTFRRPIAVLVGWPLALAVRTLDPVLPVLGTATRSLRRVFWPKLTREPYLEVEDLEKAIELSNAGQDVIRREQQVLHNILDLSEMTVEEVMRPRGTYDLWAPPVHRADVVGRLVDTDYLLIQDDGPDNIVAAVPLSALPAIPDRDIERSAEAVIHVPWCAHLSSTLEQMRSRVVSVACVVNEYGETIGVLTYEDLLDTILAPLPSRAKRVLRREPVLEVAPGRFHVDGLTTLRYLTQRLGIDHEPPHDGVITVSGLLHELLERLPAVGDECVWHDWRIKVIDVGERGKVRVMIAPIDAAPEQQTSEP